jgi:iron complex transport system substrate-binding protein
MPLFSKVATVIVAAFLSTTLFAETTYPLTILDGMGNSITLDKEPTTVSSKTLFTDEILLSILEPNRLTSLTNLATDANYSNISENLPKNVPLLDFSIEAIIANYPDLVFAANWSDAGKVEQLKNAGINVYLVNTPFSIEAIQAEILKLGQILNVEDQASALIAEMNASLASFSGVKESLASQKLVALDYNSWGTSSGVDTTWNAVLSQTGIINGSAQYEQGAFGQVTMSKELIVEINPDILFLPGWIYGDANAASDFLTQVLNDPALQSVKAIQNKRVFQIPENLRGTYSQYIVDTIDYVAHTLSDSID